MNVSIFLFSLVVVVGSVQAQTCESSISADTPSSRFKLYDNGTAFDNKTGLTWMRCPLGQTWDSGAKICSSYVNNYQWRNALSISRSTSFAGFTDWRLPNIKELNSIVERRCYLPAFNLTVFPVSSPVLTVWSASPGKILSDQTVAWGVYFSYGSTALLNKQNQYAVLLVRGGQ
ncbi:MAG: Lcl C-terminal domain-containing protein [Gammaproteobacteria bacterium]